MSADYPIGARDTCDDLSLVRAGIRPVPDYTTLPMRGEREAAQRLRSEFLPLLTRRLPNYHLCGFKHGAPVRFVARCRTRYPCFVRTDIRSFYPSVRHRDLIAGVQLAYCDLLGLRVPSGFKKRYLPLMAQWCEGLPLHRGLPLGSPLASLCAPLMLVPLWLELRRRFDVPLSVYMDDVLVGCRDEAECAAVYGFLSNRLHSDYDLELNAAKSTSGRFASQRVKFCGWSFAGGCGRISAAKIGEFLDRLARRTGKGAARTPRALVKRVNRLVDGFGHYYKHGNVKRQYEQLDTAVRRAMSGIFLQLISAGIFCKIRIIS